MSKLIERFLINIDLSKNTLFNVKVHPVTKEQRITLGSSLLLKDAGLTVFDTTEKSLYSWDGESWTVGVIRLLSIEKNPPISSTSPGTPGEIRMNATHLFICIAQDRWKRIAFSSDDYW